MQAAPLAVLERTLSLSLSLSVSLTLREQVLDVGRDGHQLPAVGLHVQAAPLAVLERAGHRVPHVHAALVHGDGASVAVQEGPAARTLRPPCQVLPLPIPATDLNSKQLGLGFKKPISNFVSIKQKTIKILKLDNSPAIQVNLYPNPTAP